MESKLKKQCMEMIKRWKENGNKITSYTCPHCKKKIKTPQPTKKLVDSKGYWDSCKVCYECNNLSFVLVYPSGKTKVNKL